MYEQTNYWYECKSVWRNDKLRVMGNDFTEVMLLVLTDHIMSKVEIKKNYKQKLGLSIGVQGVIIIWSFLYQTRTTHYDTYI